MAVTAVLPKTSLRANMYELDCWIYREKHQRRLLSSAPKAAELVVAVFVKTEKRVFARVS